MSGQTTSSTSRINKLILLLSIIVFLYWFLSRTINVYQYAIVGAIFEILWLPVLVFTFLLPVLVLWLWHKEHFAFRSLNPYSLLISVLTILVMVFYR